MKNNVMRNCFLILGLLCLVPLTVLLGVILSNSDAYLSDSGKHSFLGLDRDQAVNASVWFGLLSALSLGGYCIALASAAGRRERENEASRQGGAPSVAGLEAGDAESELDRMVLDSM